MSTTTAPPATTRRTRRPRQPLPPVSPEALRLITLGVRLLRSCVATPALDGEAVARKAHYALAGISLARAQPCRLCDHGVAQPPEGPALFWGSDPLCPSCAAAVAPELATYHAVLAAAIHHAGGDWRDLRSVA